MARKRTSTSSPSGTGETAPKLSVQADRAGPSSPSLQSRLAQLEPLPWNDTREDIITAYNRLLAALKGDA